MSAPSLATIAPELRNYIYSLVFHSDFAVTLGAGGDIQPGLTRTNRFFRGEALPMYFGTTTLNAHFVNNIDALLHLWQALGADLVLSMKEVRLWDIHNLVGKFFGEASTQHMLSSRLGNGMRYVLRPIGVFVLNDNADLLMSSALRKIVIALGRVGLTIQRFCKVDADGRKVQDMSEYAIVPQSIPDDATDEEILSFQIGLNEATRRKVLARVLGGEQVLRLRKDDRIALLFLSDHFGLRALNQIRPPEFTDDEWSELVLVD